MVGGRREPEDLEGDGANQNTAEGLGNQIAGTVYAAIL